MIKIMIVDDELIVREGIKFIVDKGFENQIEIVSMAKTGREAIEAFEKKRPHIVLMDIQMPGINGIEAIERIRDLNPHTRFVIISAYEQFEYAKSAVQLGVEDYILKPINREKLTHLLQKIKYEINEENRLKQKEIEIQEKFDKILPALEYGFIYSIIMNNDYKKESHDYHQLLDIKKEYAYIMVIELGEGENPKQLSNKIGIGVKSTIQYEHIRKAIKYKCMSVVGPLMVNRIVVLVYEEMHESEYKQRIKAVELAEVMVKRLLDITKSEAYIGIGGCHKLRHMNISYNEAIKAIGKITDEKILHIKDAVKSSDQICSMIKLKSDEEEIIRKVEEGNIEEVEKNMQLFFQKLQINFPSNMAMIRGILTELMVLVYTTNYNLESVNYSRTYMDEISKIQQFYELENYCITAAKEITNHVREEKENKVSLVIETAMDYIDKNFSKDIRLKEVAEEVAISPQYFSKIFKKELGVNFIEYLTQIRMEHAKKMLKDKSMSIKEICFIIGYNDPNYFSRLFKKVEGVSPTDYS